MALGRGQIGLVRGEEAPTGPTAMRGVADTKVKRPAAVRVTEIMNDEIPWVLAFQYKNIYGMSKSIQFTPGPGSTMNFRKDNLTISG